MSIFNRIFGIAIIFLLCTCNKNADNVETETSVNPTPILKLENNQFYISGLTFSDSLKTVYLSRIETNVPQIIDSAIVKNKTFNFSGFISNPEEYFITTNLSDSPFRFLVDASKIEVFINQNVEKSASYSSTTIQKQYKSYRDSITAFRNKGVKLYYDLKGDFSSKKIEKLKLDRVKLFAERSRYTRDFIKSNPNSYLSVILLKNEINAYGIKEIRTLFDNLSPDLKSIASVKTLDSVITEIETTDRNSKIIDIQLTETPSKKLEYRPKAYGFSGVNPYGETLSLQSIPKGKVILIDFWASWCGPCRATNPQLVTLYNKYHNQGLEIFSISEDKGTTEWINAIATDNLQWDYHIIDNNKSIAFRYGVESIPFKLLIDKNGNIASEKISGNALESRIKTLLAE